MIKYPFTPEYLDGLPERLAELYRELEDKLLIDICSRFKLSRELNESAVQKIKALRSHGISLEEIQKAIQAATGASDQEMKRVFDEVVRRNQKYYTDMIDLAKVTAPATLLSESDTIAIYNQTKQQLHNITQSMGFLVDKGKTMLPPAKAYQWALDNAVLQIESGGISYEEAIAAAVDALSDSGLKYVNYESGHVSQIDVAARRAIMTGVNQLNQKYRDQSMEYLETDLVEVTAHLGARNIDGPNGWENHAAWQGKVYRRSDMPRATVGEYPDFSETCGYGSVTGIGGANCRHSYWPFLEGITERTCTDKELEDMKPENRPKVVFDGKEYDDYQATQFQRSMERTVRKLKRKNVSFNAAGITENAESAMIKARRITAKYKEFSKKSGLPEQWDRMRVKE